MGIQVNKHTLLHRDQQKLKLFLHLQNPIDDVRWGPKDVQENRLLMKVDGITSTIGTGINQHNDDDDNNKKNNNDDKCLGFTS